MLLKRTMRKLAILVLLSFVFNIAVVDVLIAGGLKTWVKEIPKRMMRNVKGPETDLTPDKVREIVNESKNKTYNLNAANREADSSIMRPLKQIGLGIADGQIGLMKTFLSASAVNTMSGLGKSKASTLSYHKAERIAASLPPGVAKNLNKHFKSTPVGKSISSKMQQNSSNISSRVMGEAKIGLISIIGTLINTGVYDGLDVDAVKDRLINLNAIIERRRKHEEVIGSLGALYSARYMSQLFGKGFDKVYSAALARSPGLLKLDKNVARMGSKLFKADRIGVKVTASNMAEKWGMVGVGGGTRLTLQGFSKAFTMGTLFGVVGNLVSDLGWDVLVGLPDVSIIGANRNRTVELVEGRNNYFQKTGNKTKDFVEERKVAIKNRLDGRRKWPLVNLTRGIGSFLGGYVGSVIAGALMIGGGPVGMVMGIGISCLFAGVGSHLMGTFVGSKLDRSKFVMNLRSKMWKRGIEKSLNEIFFDSLGITPSKAQKAEMSRIADARLKDLLKLEGTGQAANRIKFVESLDSIDVVTKNGYTSLKISESDGQKFDEKASPRYDFIDLVGNQGMYDPITKRVYNIGKVSESTGRGVVFVSEKDIRLAGNKILAKQKDAGFDYLENGIIMSKENTKWKIKGQGTQFDIFVRETKTKYTWNGKEFVKCGSEEAKKAETLAEEKTSEDQLEEPVMEEENAQDTDTDVRVLPAGHRGEYFR